MPGATSVAVASFGRRYNVTEPAQQELIETFRSLSDEYLLERVRSGDLTDLARGLAEQEVRQRGIEPAADSTPEPPREPPKEAQPIQFVTVARFLVPLEALAAKARLEAEGIPVLFADANLVQTNDLLAIAVGGIKLQVLAALAPEAAEIIAALRAGTFCLSDDSPGVPDGE
jgi:hypothetical protein